MLEGKKPRICRRRGGYLVLRTVSSCQVNIYKHSRCSLGNTSPTDTPGAPPPMLSPMLLQP